MRKHLKNVAHVFIWIDKEDEELKDGNGSHQIQYVLNIYYTFHVL